MSRLEIVILEQFLVLEVAEFRLDSVKLVAKSQVVLIALLDLENFSLKLADEQILLI